jgi:hypothetical protein
MLMRLWFYDFFKIYVILASSSLKKLIMPYKKMTHNHVNSALIFGFVQFWKLEIENMCLIGLSTSTS